MNITDEQLYAIVLHQLKQFWLDVNEKAIFSAIPNARQAIIENYTGLPNIRFYDGQDVAFSPYISVQWMNFLYRLSHELYIQGSGESADQVYYLNKIMHNNDWFYAVELPTHFLCEHPLGSVLGRAKYGDYFFVYQGTTVGGNRKDGILYYPTIGRNVLLYANATVLGDTTIGNNVIVSADSYLINETIPDNCIVLGKSPNIIVKVKSEDEIKKHTKHIWGW